MDLKDLYPSPRYVIAGSTHPKVLKSEGEAYRDMLMARARSNGVASSVTFDPTYRDLPSLTALIQDATVVVLPYDSRDQVTSGVLVDAIAAGRPVVATAFPHAVELLSSGAGNGRPSRRLHGSRRRVCTSSSPSPVAPPRWPVRRAVWPPVSAGRQWAGSTPTWLNSLLVQSTAVPARLAASRVFEYLVLSATSSARSPRGRHQPAEKHGDRTDDMARLLVVTSREADPSAVAIEARPGGAAVRGRR